jgi:hypothetical protein
MNGSVFLQDRVGDNLINEKLGFSKGLSFELLNEINNAFFGMVAISFNYITDNLRFGDNLKALCLFPCISLELEHVVVHGGDLHQIAVELPGSRRRDKAAFDVELLSLMEAQGRF